MESSPVATRRSYAHVDLRKEAESIELEKQMNINHSLTTQLAAFNSVQDDVRALEHSLATSEQHRSQLQAQLMDAKQRLAAQESQN